MPSIAYTRWVHRVWDRLAECSCQPPMYLDRENVAAYCPVCREGTIRILFIEQPEPTIRITSNAWPGHCSLGCRARTIFEVLKP